MQVLFNCLESIEFALVSMWFSTSTIFEILLWTVSINTVRVHCTYTTPILCLFITNSALLSKSFNPPWNFSYAMSGLLGIAMLWFWLSPNDSENKSRKYSFVCHEARILLGNCSDTVCYHLERWLEKCHWTKAIQQIKCVCLANTLIKIDDYALQ